ncbi:sigma-70 family RNA polymerase sigma factor [Chitinophaga pendula]|uniref:RNA polymerase sigma factor n=1 Tax=Chitinophaga TaxID=79328 RepID=UPI000BAF2D48|nr:MULTISPECIES: sigma-70 family RNA polymerase sigma factor [Chitinophaga]ASZ12289.1 RNA polymerase subunit sigma-24 [Chitinophaga sp. MD30]UCJ10122.1 sigma-70 family RNA polymerase sigma factor [Chitinophaga pendula]
MEGNSHDIMLLRSLADGSMAAFDTFYHRYKQAVYANIYKMVRQSEAAEDLLQEVFIALWQHRHRLDAERSVSGWLFVVSYNKAASYLKQQLRAGVVHVPTEALAQTLPAEEQEPDELYQVQLAVIEAAIDRLPARKQAVFRLCKLEGKSYEEVAATLHLSVPSVKDYLKQSTRLIKHYIHSEYSSTPLTAVALLALVLDQL